MMVILDLQRGHGYLLVLMSGRQVVHNLKMSSWMAS